MTLRATTLPYASPALLLAELVDVDGRVLARSSADMMSVNGSDGPTVHLYALQRMFEAVADGDSVLRLWEMCVDCLREVRAPLHNDACSDDAMTVLMRDQFQASRAGLLSVPLLQRYIVEGLLDVSELLPGKLPTQTQFADARIVGTVPPLGGMRPLAAAIIGRCPEVVQLLLDLGASTDVGPVERSSPPRDAYGLARTFRHSAEGAAVHAILMERHMREHMMTRAAGLPATHLPAPRSRRARL